MKRAKLSHLSQLGQLDYQTVEPFHGGQQARQRVQLAIEMKINLGLQETASAVRSQPVPSRRRERGPHQGGIHQAQLLEPTQPPRHRGENYPQHISKFARGNQRHVADATKHP